MAVYITTTEAFTPKIEAAPASKRALIYAMLERTNRGIEAILDDDKAVVADISRLRPELDDATVYGLVGIVAQHFDADPELVFDRYGAQAVTRCRRACAVMLLSDLGQTRKFVLKYFSIKNVTITTYLRLHEAAMRGYDGDYQRRYLAAREEAFQSSCKLES